MGEKRVEDAHGNSEPDTQYYETPISLIAERDVLIAECSDLSGRLGRLRELHNLKMRQRFAELKELTEVVEQKSNEISKLRTDIEEMKTSLSWRITLPLRALRRRMNV